MSRHTNSDFINKVIDENLVKTKHDTNIFRVIHPLHVFKSVWTSPNGANRRKAIANLIIPTGALVHIPESRHDLKRAHNSKCRASEAYVHSIVSVAIHQQATVGHSDWSWSFRYHVGRIVEPQDPFLKANGICEPGIHFFFDLDNAKEYL